MIHPKRRALGSAGGRSHRRPLRLTLIVWSAIVIAVVGGAVAREHWLRLRQGLDEMRLALVDAREQHQAMRLRLGTAESRLREQLDLLGLDAGVNGGPGQAAAPAHARVTAVKTLASGEAGSTWRIALASHLVDSAAELEAGGDAQGVANGLRQLAADIRAKDAGASRQPALLAHELNGLAAALAASTRIDWPDLKGRLDALVQAANRLLPPRIAMLVERPAGAQSWSVEPTRHQRGLRSSDQSNHFRWALRSQLEVAESAIQLRDLALLRLSGAAVQRLIEAHYPHGSADAAGLTRQLTGLRRAVKAMDRDAVAARIEILADMLLAEAVVDRAPAASVSVPVR
jgi:hypothetical protein